MKKKYKKPAFEVINLIHPVLLFEGSSEGGSDNLNPGGGGTPV